MNSMTARRRVAGPVLRLLVPVMAYLLPAVTGSHAAEGPLFIQVHYASPLSGISMEQVMGICDGRVRDFSELGIGRGPMRVRADRHIVRRLRSRFPRLSFIEEGFTRDGPTAADRNFVGISDSRGLLPCFKALYIDAALPWGKLHDDCSLSRADAYPFTMEGAEPFDAGAHVSIVQTGVTAMTRAFIAAVDRSGDLRYPVRHTAPITSRADIALTSNEVSFLDPCAYPLRDRMTFCSPLRFFRILEESGFDVIELTGNHNNDYGCGYNRATMDALQRAGMEYFGGGRNTAESGRVLIKKTKNARFAFAGFNEMGPPIAWATEKCAGAARLSREPFVRSVREAVSKSDAAFVSVQWGNENDPSPWKLQREYFHRAAELGAAVIVSSSAHRVMGIEFRGNSFISYGLGNFLFDQMQTMSHRRGLMARHHFYRGRHVQTELIPYVIHDWCQPRPARGREAREIMEEVFRLSEGPVFK